VSRLYGSEVGRKFFVQATPNSSVLDRLSPATYLSLLLAPALILILITVPWTRYAAVAPGKWMMPEMDYRYTLRNVNADVVIFGDSTGLVSLDPLVMRQDLHQSVVNVASLSSVFSVQLDDMLDHYLQYNKRPKLLVVSLSPWELRVDHVNPNNSYEGIVMLIRHGTWSQIRQFTLHHPVVMLSFEFQALRSLLNPIPNQDADLQHGLLGKHLGFAPIEPPSLEHPCKTLSNYQDPQIPDGLPEHFYQKYSSAGTKVLVLMAPVPDCTGSEEFRHPLPHNAWLVPSLILPADEIGGDGRHLEGRMTTWYSHKVDQDIEAYLEQMGNATPQMAAADTPGLTEIANKK
jgi:hypothetical protein